MVQHTKLRRICLRLKDDIPHPKVKKIMLQFSEVMKKHTNKINKKHFNTLNGQYKTI